jgi:hypothetical protein
MPLLATKAVACSSPVDGLYKYLALLVYTVVAVPLVALAKMGYRLVAVAVSLLIVEPPTGSHAGDAPL